jgi:succinyl-diaminopimelate desuccinylase
MTKGAEKREARAQIVRWIDEDRDLLIDTLVRFVRAKSPNPPADTREACQVLCRFLEERELPFRIVASDETMPNIVGTFDCAQPGRHVIFNGHMDVFPVGDSGTWTHDPWGGEIEDGRIYGRGVNDMKAGTASIAFAYHYLYRLREQLAGRVTMTAVSEEETFGPNGARHLVEACPEVLGDVCLSTEPTGIESVRFAEKAANWLRFTVRTPGAHGAYPHKSENANVVAAKLVLDLLELQDMEVKAPEVIVRALTGADDVIDRVASPGAAQILQKLTVNIGVLKGGTMLNMLPGTCVVEADVRVPIGVDADDMVREAGRIAARYPAVTMEVVRKFNPLWSDPEHEVCRLIQANAEEIGGFLPPAIVSLPSTDVRLWRMRGIPAFVYGITPHNVAMADEYAEIDEIIHVLKVHTLSAFDFLSR